jgi:hypothetical protein
MQGIYRITFLVSIYFFISVPLFLSNAYERWLTGLPVDTSIASPIIILKANEFSHFDPSQLTFRITWTKSRRLFGAGGGRC